MQSLFVKMTKYSEYFHAKLTVLNKCGQLNILEMNLLHKICSQHNPYFIVAVSISAYYVY